LQENWRKQTKKFKLIMLLLQVKKQALIDHRILKTFHVRQNKINTGQALIVPQGD
jgi:hypothetical protein